MVKEKISKDDILEKLYGVFHVSKGEIARFCLTEDERRKIDYARPMGWDKKAREIGVDPNYFVWSYIENRHGEPLNLLEKLMDKFYEYRNIIEQAFQEDM